MVVGVFAAYINAHSIPTTFDLYTQVVDKSKTIFRVYCLIGELAVKCWIRVS